MLFNQPFSPMNLGENCLIQMIMFTYFEEKQLRRKWICKFLSKEAAVKFYSTGPREPAVSFGKTTKRKANKPDLDVASSSKSVLKDFVKSVDPFGDREVDLASLVQVTKIEIKFKLRKWLPGARWRRTQFKIRYDWTDLAPDIIASEE